MHKEPLWLYTQFVLETTKDNKLSTNLFTIHQIIMPNIDNNDPNMSTLKQLSTYHYSLGSSKSLAPLTRKSKLTVAISIFSRRKPKTKVKMLCLKWRSTILVEAMKIGVFQVMAYCHMTLYTFWGLWSLNIWDWDNCPSIWSLILKFIWKKIFMFVMGWCLISKHLMNK